MRNIVAIEGTCAGVCMQCPHVKDNPGIDINLCREQMILQKSVKIEKMLAFVVENMVLAAPPHEGEKYIVTDAPTADEAPTEQDTTQVTN